MAGIYFHIPFCKQACHYCDFHFSTSLRLKEDLLLAMKKELAFRAADLGNELLTTIYFGGGTPSLLTRDELNSLFDTISQHLGMDNKLEITLEANPDDLTNVFVRELRQTPVNRLSVGIQSFYDEDLRWMNRAHQAREAEAGVKRLQDAGFENLTIDLIYGFPLLSNEKWHKNLLKTKALQVPHVSAYSMTVEERTALSAFIRKGIQKPMDERQSAEQFLFLRRFLAEAGLDQYEISNFARPGFESEHNSNYWKGVPYLGIGPSAHSFADGERKWNVRNNALYIKALAEGGGWFEQERLTPEDRINEHIMTMLRTRWGIDLGLVARIGSEEMLKGLEDNMQPHLEKGALVREGTHIRLSMEAQLFADRIASDLFLLKREH